MRILHFINGMHPGGKERRLVELLKSIVDSHSMDVELALMSRDIRYPEVVHLGIPLHFLIRRTKWDPLIFLKLYRLCTNRRPDIIHAWDTMTALYAAPVAFLLNIPFINGMINEAPEKPIAWQSRFRSMVSFPFSSVIVANSHAGLDAYDAPVVKSVCIYNGFDPSRFLNLPDPDQTRSRLGIGRVKIVGMVGEFAARKDYRTFILAAQQVLRKRNDVAFLAVGDGPMFQSCKALVSSEFRERIIFPGWLTDVETVEAVFDIGVLATFTEGISNAILEYMVLGKPVVATDGGGTKELVLDGKSGFLVRCQDVDDLERRIMELLENPGLAAAMGEEGKKRAFAEFTIRRMTDRYLDLYRSKGRYS